MRSLNVLLEVGDKWVTSDHYVPAQFFSAGKRQDRLPNSTAPKGPKGPCRKRTPGGSSGL